MLDLNFVRDNLPLVEEKLRQRGMDPATVLKDFREVDTQRRQAITEAETMKARRNRASEDIGKLKKSGQDASALMAETKDLREQIQTREKTAADLDARLGEILSGIPNIPHASVPVGNSAEQNVEVRRWGRTPQFNFNPQPHWELGEQLRVLDLERAVKLTGARFAVYWDLGAKLERALANFMLDLHTREHGYTEVLPPYLVNSDSMYGTGNLPKFAADLFRVPHGDKDLWLIPTAEVPVTNLYRDEILDAARLPISLTAYTPCFRSEAGSYGKDVRGIIRQHQFQKVELVKFARPENSYDEHERLTLDAEEVLQKLGLHYRVVTLCTGDMGPSAAKTYDIEVWLPGQKLFREISSCSNFEAYQARRANIRYRPDGKNKPEFVHTLNGSGLAVGRTWVAIVENYQQADGSVVIPEVLRPYIGADRITPKKFEDSSFGPERPRKSADHKS
ncbi:MAG: serine--tRNA ligase [Acidobacteria bacterium]|jgi:seryl-tRNA synthetase|nr:MAG: serine--tRNA ligase [Acidobacteriota bacterium]